MGVHERTQEVLASPYCGGVTALWQLGGADTRFSGSPVYLHPVLMSCTRGGMGATLVRCGGQVCTALLVAQCLNWIEMGSFASRIKTEENPHSPRKDYGK